MPVDSNHLQDMSGQGFKPVVRTHATPSNGVPRQTLTSSSLVQRVQNPSQITSFSFDAVGHQERKEALELQVQGRVEQLNQGAVLYAQSLAAQVMSDIDMAAASIRANAFDQMGLGGTDASQEKPNPCSEK